MVCTGWLSSDHTHRNCSLHTMVSLLFKFFLVEDLWQTYTYDGRSQARVWLPILTFSWQRTNMRLDEEES